MELQCNRVGSTSDKSGKKYFKAKYLDYGNNIRTWGQWGGKTHIQVNLLKSGDNNDSLWYLK